MEGRKENEKLDQHEPGITSTRSWSHAGDQIQRPPVTPRARLPPPLQLLSASPARQPLDPWRLVTSRPMRRPLAAGHVEEDDGVRDPLAARWDWKRRCGVEARTWTD
jgi:hypothetical protein